MWQRVKQGAYVSAVLAAAVVIFVAVLIGMDPGLIDIGISVNDTTWVLFAVSGSVLAMFVMLLALRAAT